MPSASWSETGLFIYLSIFCLVYLTAHTLFNIPYEALDIEQTDDTHERTRLYAFRGLFPPVLGLGASWVYAFIQSDFFPDALTGMRVVGIGFALLMDLTCVWPALLLRERAPKDKTKKQRIPLLKSIAGTFSNRPFHCVIFIRIFAQLAKNVFD